ncbi:pseudouridine synthase [Desulfonauticus submarinus]
MRLNKYISQAGFTSRRKADQLIFNGQVKVNRQIITKPYFQVNPEQDIVEIQNHIIKINPKPFTLVLNKPIHVITSLSDPQNRTTIYDLLPPKIKQQRPIPIGRLDYFSEGLLLLTTDGELCYRLTHPKYKVEKIYLVRLRGKSIKEKLKKMEQGMTLLEGEYVFPARTKIIKENKSFTLVEIIIKQGLNRQIRRMCRDLDLTILQLKRVQIGPIKLKNLKPGKHRLLNKNEINTLYSNVGLNPP